MENEHQVITVSPIFTNNTTIIHNIENENKCLKNIKKFNNLPILIKVIILGGIIGILAIGIFIIYALVEFRVLFK
jgi:hypothetical protein